MNLGKKIAIIVRDRQAEALRMAVGLTIFNAVDIYIMDRKLEESEQISLNLEMIREMKLGLYTNTYKNKKIEYIATETLAKKLLEYDNILPY